MNDHFNTQYPEILAEGKAKVSKYCKGEGAQTLNHLRTPLERQLTGLPVS